MLNENVEDYLKAIYGISTIEFVSTNDIAEKLGYSPSNVSKMLKRLSELEFVEYISHRGVKLTESGVRESIKILRRHRLLEMFLFKALGYKWDEIHKEACVLEHHISVKFENAIDEFLGYPTRDPHGDPIPDKNGNMMSYNVVPLSEVEIGKSVRIIRILGNNADFLKYLADLNLLPDTSLKLLKKEPFAGSIIIESNKAEKILGLDAAKLILVEIEN